MMNPLAFLKNLRAEKSDLDLSIASYQQAELHWNERQAIDWIQNVLKERYHKDTTLHNVIRDGTVLCRLLTNIEEYYVPKEFRKTSSSFITAISNGHLKIMERVTFFISACKEMGISAPFEPLDVIENRNTRHVIACLEQVMKRTKVKRKFFNWPSKSVQVSCQIRNQGTGGGGGGEEEKNIFADIEISPDTQVGDLKSKVAAMKNIPLEDQQKYSICLHRSNPEGGEEEDIWLDEESTLGSHELDHANDQFLFCHVKKQMLELMRSSSLETSLRHSMSRKTITPLPTLLKNDKIKFYYHNISHLHKFDACMGDLYLTKFHLMFIPFEPGDRNISTCNERGFKIPIASISHIIKCTGMKSDIGKFRCFQLQCKDFHAIKFSYLDNPALNLRRSAITSRMLAAKVDFKTPLHMALDKHVFRDHDSLFAWANKGGISGYDGWNAYSPAREFQRLGVPDAVWRITNINENYEMSDTYPAVLVVPVDMPDPQLVPIFAYRSKGRIPTLCWRHKNGAAMLRCSQPLTGLMGRTCPQDAAYFECLHNHSVNSDVNINVLIYDARPRINAVANQIMGKGVEVPYPNTELRFGKIENIHCMREAHKKLWKFCLESNSMTREKHLQKVHVASAWLEHIGQILATALEIVGAMDLQCSTVVVHCSDGWDRTPQLTALAQIIMDPYYRTIEGLAILIEKEWLSFGHKFEDRIGHATKEHEQERSPIFLQFLDAIFQLLNICPTSFEFTSNLLHAISTNVVTCCFGTFLFNSEMERQKADVKNRTVSLWSHINFHKDKFVNPSYVPATGAICHDLGGYDLQLWKDHFLYWHHYHEGVW